jgi:hypothetical protein
MMDVYRNRFGEQVERVPGPSPFKHLERQAPLFAYNDTKGVSGELANRSDLTYPLPAEL